VEKTNHYRRSVNGCRMDMASAAARLARARGPEKLIFGPYKNRG
jgi:hypothetical protein